MRFSMVSDAFESMAIDIDQKLCYTLDTVNTYMHRPCLCVLPTCSCIDVRHKKRVGIILDK